MNGCSLVTFSDFLAFADAAEEFHPDIQFFATFNAKVNDKVKRCHIISQDVFDTPRVSRSFTEIDFLREIDAHQMYCIFEFTLFSRKHNSKEYSHLKYLFIAKV